MTMAVARDNFFELQRLKRENDRELTHQVLLYFLTFQSHNSNCIYL